MKTQSYKITEQDLLVDIISQLHFNPAILVTLMLDLYKRGKLTDHRPGPRLAFFPDVDYDAAARPFKKLGL